MLCRNILNYIDNCLIFDQLSNAKVERFVWIACNFVNNNIANNYRFKQLIEFALLNKINNKTNKKRWETENYVCLL